MLKHFRVDIGITILALIGAFFYGGWAILPLTVMLIAMEIVFSFDNAAVNAKYLAKMSHFWRTMFLTVGILIAVFGMRLVFPFAVVSIAGGVTPAEAWTLAMERGDPETPGTYGYILDQAHYSIAAFGGMFLLMLFLNFVFDHERDEAWIAPIERPLQKAGQVESMPALVSLAALLACTQFLVTDDHRFEVLLSGTFGIVTYLLVDGLAAYMEKKQEEAEERLAALEVGQTALLTGKAAFSMFMFLEVLDASFSFDGVLGAFALTSDPIIIAIGLGVGALFVRSMTIYLVNQGTLSEYRFMEHGAHWAIGLLATLLLLTLRFDIPDWLIGLGGLFLIAVSIWASVRANKRDRLDGVDGGEGLAVAEHAPGIHSSHPHRVTE